MSRFARAAWATLAYNVLTILWGAFVRATGSGAGCGAHWPLCNGEVIPRAPAVATMIELSHRITAGLSLVATVALAIYAARVFPRGARARKLAITSAVFSLGEALIGAVLVLYEWVAHDQSLKRGVSGALHLVNTFLLLGALTLTAHFASTNERARLRGALPWLAIAVMGGMLLLGMSGAVTALGDTLFPPRSLSEGLAQDLSPTAHLFLKLRVFHPILGVSVGAGVFALAGATPALSSDPRARAHARALGALFFVQIGLGFANVALLAPVWMQLVHLLVADLVWITLVLLFARSLVGEAPRAAPALEASAARSAKLRT